MGSETAMWTRTWAGGRWVLVLLLAGVACTSTLLHLEIARETETTVERGTLLEELVGDLGLADFIAMDITSAQEIQNQGVQPGDINEVRLTMFQLEATTPEGGDVAFIERLELFVEGPGLPRERVAWQDTFPEGQAIIDFELDDLDLTAYVVSEALTLTTDVTGTRPDEDHTIVARFALDVAVTTQGACNAASGG